MDRELDGVLFEWRGPAPFHHIAVPPEVCGDLAAVAAQVGNGWDMVPATVTIDDSTWDTSLHPEDGGYLVPVRDRIRVAEGLADDDRVHMPVQVRV